MQKKKTRGLSTLIAIVMKSKKLTIAFKALKSVKFLKPLITLGTMFLSLFVYGFAYGWVFAIGIIAMIFIHEMGHVIALRQKGYPASPPIFIPLLGAVIFAPKKMERDTEAYVGIGGPVLGSLGAIVAWFIWWIHPDHPMLWLIMSYIGIMINLFNMLPVRPLDGGRVTQAVGHWFNWVGIGLLLALTLALKDPGLLLIWVLVLDDMTRVPIKLRASIVIIIWILLFVCTILGVGETPRWVLIMDSGIAFIFGLFIVIRAFGKPSEEMKQIEEEIAESSGLNRPQLEFPIRMKWLTSYVVLVVMLIGCMFYQQHTIKPWIEKQKKEKEIKTPSPQISQTCPSRSRFLY